MHFLVSLIFIAISSATAAFPPTVSVAAELQFATVMRSEDYVYNNGTVGAFPSLFIGLIHMALIPIANTTTGTLQVTVWHQVDFATQIELRAAPPGFANTDLLPLFVIASTGLGNVAPTNCPIMKTFVVDAIFIANLTNSLIYAQILADQSAGLLRGQFWSRRDVAVAFPSTSPFTGANYDATAGMAIIYAQPVPGDNKFVTLEYWILSRYLPTAIWNANDGYANFTTAVAFGVIPVTQTTGVTLTITPTGAPLIVAPTALVFTARMAENPAGVGPITGPGSSKLVLSLQREFSTDIFSEFIRLAYYQDFLYINTSALSAAARPRAGFFWTGILAALVSFFLI